MTMELVRYDAMCRAIDAAHEVDEVKDIRDKAVALEHYARQAQNTDAERRACEIRLRAERKAGQLLARMDQKANGRPSKEKRSSSQWQKLGAMPQREFDLAIGESVKPPTTKGILRAAADPDGQPKRKVSPEALWLWGRLLDFERDGLLGESPDDVLRTMTEPMKDDVHRLAPKVAGWLRRIGAMQ